MGRSMSASWACRGDFWWLTVTGDIGGTTVIIPREDAQMFARAVLEADERPLSHEAVAAMEAG